jgi:DNA polymerase III epsilon subunit-like protein
MKALILDTETSGLPTSYKASFADTKAWPRVVEIAWIILEDGSRPISSSTFIVRPDGFQISQGATSIHGISTEKASAEGNPLRYVLACLAEDLSEVDLVVAHNIDFDFPVINCEFLRMNMPSSLGNKSRFCTMKSTTDLCNLPGNNGPKWPKLEELYRFLFLRSFSEAHRAMHDVKATTECYIELNRRGLA